MIITNPEQLNSKLASLHAKGKYAEILSLMKSILSKVSSSMERCNCYRIMATAYAGLYQYDKAKKYTEESLKIQDSENMRYQLSLYELHLKNVKDGFFHYGARWSMPEMSDLKQKFAKYSLQELQKFDDVIGKRILITGEQGLGDELMFSRILSILVDKCSYIEFVLSKQVRPLIQHCYPNIITHEIGTNVQDISTRFDHIITIADIFRLYVLDYDIPPVQSFKPSEIIQIDNNKLKIGFVYSTGKTSDTATVRSINPKKFKELETLGDLYSFQIPEDPLLFVKDSFGNKINNFLDTANYASAMDVIVTCDTSFAHLTLGLNKPTIIAYDKYIDWRWKIPLYPNVKKVSIHGAFEKKIKQAIDEFK
jgi:hypothetical protein